MPKITLLVSLHSSSEGSKLYTKYIVCIRLNFASVCEDRCSYIHFLNRGIDICVRENITARLHTGWLLQCIEVHNWKVTHTYRKAMNKITENQSNIFNDSINHCFSSVSTCILLKRLIPFCFVCVSSNFTWNF